MPKADLRGKRSGRLVAVEPTDGRKNGKVVWRCACDCGGEALVIGACIANGQTKSCGCLTKEGTRTTHGGRHTVEYRIWSQMRNRCENPNAQAFSGYGGRGIKVCERWREFPNFLADMGPRPSPRHTIDRIDNDQGYGPDNCRWATWKEQQRNRRSNVIYKVDGIAASLAEHCERLGLKYSTVHRRLTQGASIERALSPGRAAYGTIKKKALAVTVKRLMQQK